MSRANPEKGEQIVAELDQAGSEQFIRDNAVAIVRDAELAAARHREELRRMNNRNRAYKEQLLALRRRVEELQTALTAIYEWYDRDGSVGGAANVFEDHRAAAEDRHGRAPDRCVLALRQRVAELEVVAARRLELLRPFAGLIVHDRPNHPPQWPLFDTLADSAEHEEIEVNVGHVRAAAAEVAAEKGANRG